MVQNSIVGLPMVVSIGKWMWGKTPNPNISPEICMLGFPLSMSTDCWMQVGVKVMGLSMIVGACGNKAPTLVNIIQSKSVAGLPKSSIYGEAIIAANATLYGYLQGFPYSAYGENAAIALQCIMVMALMWHYSEPYKTADSIATRRPLDIRSAAGKSTRLVTTLQEKLFVICISTFYVFSVIYFLPPSLQHLLLSSVMPLMIYARGCQILEAYTLQHTGAQSVATTAISLGGNLGRLMTTIKEVGFDRAALSWYLVSAMLNSIMFVQYGLYRKNTKLFQAELRRQKTYVLPKEA
jgi:mannose-P-dolichol utilization defect 1